MSKFTSALFPVLMFFGIPGALSATALISLQPAASTIAAGSPFTLTVAISGVTDLYDYQFDVIYSPSILNASGDSEDSFLSGGGSTFFIAGSIDNISGAYTNIADTLQDPVPGVSGSGPLTDIQFLGVGPGLTTVTLANIILQDSNGNDIPFTTAGAAVTVTVAPEPATAGMLLAGLALAFRARKSRRP